MQSRTTSAALAVVGVIVIAVLFVVLRDDDDGGAGATQATTTAEATTADGAGGGNDKPKPPPEPEPATIVVRNGEPVGGVQELEFEQGGRIAFVVESDVDDEVHLHGYDIGKEVTAGGEVAFDVPATIDGVFEVELEESVVPIAEVTVSPG